MILGTTMLLRNSSVFSRHSPFSTEWRPSPHQNQHLLWFPRSREIKLRLMQGKRSHEAGTWTLLRTKARAAVSSHSVPRYLQGFLHTVRSTPYWQSEYWSFSAPAPHGEYRELEWLNSKFGSLWHIAACMYILLEVITHARKSTSAWFSPDNDQYCI